MKELNDNTRSGSHPPSAPRNASHPTRSAASAPDCVFCKIATGEIPCNKIYEDEYTLAFHTIRPEREGHFLVIPKKHIRNIRDCDPQTMVYLLKTIQYVTRNLPSFKIVQNNDYPIQEIFHLHFHILPFEGKPRTE